MAVPKKKLSDARSKRRKSANAQEERTALAVCAHCGAANLPHTVCSSCGYYKGEKVQ